MSKTTYFVVGSFILSIIVAIITNNFDIYSILSILGYSLSVSIAGLILYYQDLKVKRENSIMEIQKYWDDIQSKLEQMPGQYPLNWNRGKDNIVRQSNFKINNESCPIFAYICLMSVVNTHVCVYYNAKKKDVHSIISVKDSRLLIDPFKSFNPDKTEVNSFIPNLGVRDRVHNTFKYNYDNPNQDIPQDDLDKIGNKFEGL